MGNLVGLLLGCWVGRPVGFLDGEPDAAMCKSKHQIIQTDYYSYANPLYLPGVTVGPLVGLLEGLCVGLRIVGGLVSPGLVGPAVGFRVVGGLLSPGLVGRAVGF